MLLTLTSESDVMTSDEASVGAGLPSDLTEHSVCAMADDEYDDGYDDDDDEDDDEDNIFTARVSRARESKGRCVKQTCECRGSYIRRAWRISMKKVG